MTPSKRQAPTAATKSSAHQAPPRSNSSTSSSTSKTHATGPPELASRSQTEDRQPVTSQQHSTNKQQTYVTGTSAGVPDSSSADHSDSSSRRSDVIEPPSFEYQHRRELSQSEERLEQLTLEVVKHQPDLSPTVSPRRDDDGSYGATFAVAGIHDDTHDAPSPRYAKQPPSYEETLMRQQMHRQGHLDITVSRTSDVPGTQAGAQQQ